MVKQQYQYLLDDIGTLSDVWQARMGIEYIRITHSFHENYHPDDLEGNSDSRTPAQCNPQWQYLRADIEWYLPVLVTLSHEEVARAVIHELVHVLLGAEQSDLKPAQQDRMELSTEMVVRALEKAYG